MSRILVCVAFGFTLHLAATLLFVVAFWDGSANSASQNFAIHRALFFPIGDYVLDISGIEHELSIFRWHIALPYSLLFGAIFGSICNKLLSYSRSGDR